ncbi:MAG: flavohemoglobin expression-modulating QEGLA motif protein, partial [Ginsengibacter sp.]
MPDILDIRLVENISNSLSRGKSIRRNLPLNSKLVIDQKLPYLCVYRFKEKIDLYISSLLKAQGAYLIANAELDVSSLLKTIIEISIKEFRSFMIVEIWNEETAAGGTNIRLLYPGGKVTATIETFEKGFNEFKKFLPRIQVLPQDTKQRHPADLPPLIELDELKKTGTLLIGVAIESLFRDEESKKYYPLFFRKIRRKFAEVIKMAAFEFVRMQSDNKFEHYLMLGKTRLDNLVRSADTRIAAISEKMDFILSVTPVNTSIEWENFQKNNFSKTPHFTYRLISLDPEIEKRNLFDIPIENIEHPTLAFLLRDKRMELEKQLIMLEERGTKKFLHTSQSIYGDIDEELKNAAISLLNDEVPNEQTEFSRVNAVDFACAAQAELEKYREQFPQLDLRVKVKDDVSGLIVSATELSIGKDLTISAERVEALIQHEVGTHILTYCNGRVQPVKLMYAGFAGYEQLQEGIAVLSEFFVGGLNINRLKLLAARVIAVDALIHGADFIETYNMLCNNYGFSNKTSFNISMRVHRGGGYTKDAIYLKGLMQVLDFIKNGGDITHLYGGKFALEHLPLVEELVHLKILKKPYLPPYLST